MDEYKKAIIECIVRPIINYLESQNPNKHYHANISQSNDHGPRSTIVVKEKGLFGSKVCTISNSALSGSYCHSENLDVLPQQKLEELARDADIDDTVYYASFREKHHHN